MIAQQLYWLPGGSSSPTLRDANLDSWKGGQQAIEQLSALERLGRTFTDAGALSAALGALTDFTTRT